MARLRCPYCQKIFGPEPSARCLHCGKMAVVPASMRKTTFRERQRMRDRIQRDAERSRRNKVVINPRFGRSPAMLGFTILGLLVLGALLIGNAIRIQPIDGQRVSRESRALREVEVLHKALERFHADIGRYPTEEEGLKALVLNPGIPGWTRHYVNVVKPDPWRTPYHYSLTPEGRPQVRSFGADLKPFTEDDITLPEAESGSLAEKEILDADLVPMADDTVGDGDGPVIGE